MSQLWPNLRRTQHHYRLCLSHDVDSPYRVLGRPTVACGAGRRGRTSRSAAASRSAAERSVECPTRLPRRRRRRSVQYVRVHHVDERSALARECLLLHHSPTQRDGSMARTISNPNTVAAADPSRSSARPRNRLASRLHDLSQQPRRRGRICTVPRAVRPPRRAGSQLGADGNIISAGKTQPHGPPGIRPDSITTAASATQPTSASAAVLAASFPSTILSNADRSNCASGR